GDGVPVRSVRGVDRSGSVERLPDPAAGGGEVDDVRVGRMHEDVAHPPGIDLVEDDSVSLEVGAPGSEVDPSVARSTHGLKRIACAPGSPPQRVAARDLEDPQAILGGSRAFVELTPDQA